MKKLSSLLFVLMTSLTFAQNVDDNKVQFTYIQLPQQKINTSYTKYEVRVNHHYKKANIDSNAVFIKRKETDLKNFETQYALWLEQKKNSDRTYYAQMAQYEKSQNAGTPIALPSNPIYPPAPTMPILNKGFLHTEMADADVNNKINIEGFEKGLGGFIVTLDIHPMHSTSIVEKKTGSGTSTKYEYVCQYILPIEVTLETPTEGKLYKKMLFESVRTQQLKTFASKYEYLSWFMDNSDKYLIEVEREARKASLQEINNTLNIEFGYVKTTRYTEIYTIKKYKNYDYKDVIEAYTLTSQAFNLIAKDRNRASAQAKIDLAINKWKAILEESNTVDDKARINDKITAMIQCNLAELYVWKGGFDESDLYLNLALNSGVLKFKTHANRMREFYTFQKTLWNVHY